MNDRAARPGSAALDLVRAVGDLTFEDLPEATVRYAAEVVADTLGVICAGHEEAEMVSLRGRAPVAPRLSDGAADLITADPERVDPGSAAFMNGTAGTFLELDEGYRPTGHPMIHVLPAALAVAQAEHHSGTALLRAVIAGYEVSARLFEAYALRYPLHPHGHLGSVGAAVAVALLRRRDPRVPAGIAATFPLVSVWDACFEGATTRNAYAGFAGSVGVMANDLAAAGFTPATTALDTAFDGLVGDKRSDAPLTTPVDPGNLRLHGNYVKFHSACALAHAALDAIEQLAPDPADVGSVEVETVSNNLKLARFAQPNSLSTRFSLPYAVAAAIHHGHTKPSAFAYDARVDELSRRVSVSAAGDLDAAWPDAAPARVILRRSDGSTETQTVDNPRGHHANPPAEGDLATKFVQLVNRSDAAALHQRLLALDTVPDCVDVWRPSA